MVEQTRQPSRVISHQAGPGEVDSVALFSVNLRVSDTTVRTLAHQLATIGDQLDREWAKRDLYRMPTPLHMLGPARALTRIIYRDIHSQLWGLQGLSAAVKAWITSTAPGQGVLRADTWATWVSSVKPAACPGWTRRVLVTAALVAAVTFWVHCGWAGQA
ncbi:uncharacterized protein V6R79_015759 [Siganus canaliculatus]